MQAWASFLAAIVFFVLTVPTVAKDKSKSVPDEVIHAATPILWANPKDIASRDLFYGPGGKTHQPHAPFTFLEEDLNGTQPKFVVRDENGIKWKAKLGPETRPEIVATRLLWAVGYFANEDYFLADLRVEDMQPLKRGQKLIGPGGTVHNARLKRSVKGEKKNRRLALAS